ncbi:MAG: TlpA family protein disulfide reductase, partial [Mucilaginibacter sp.]
MPQSVNPVEKPEQILKNIMSLLDYQQAYLHFSEDYSAFDTSGVPITKGIFLSKLSEGKYLPLCLKTKTKVPVYQLFHLPPGTSRDIVTTVAGWGRMSFENYKMEGRRLPNFYFTDLKGRVYSEVTTKNKIIVLKCWYLACQACRLEIPELNRLVEKYKDRKDIV